jgi:alpha-glucosidase
MGLLLLMGLRGNVFVYQGEELGLPQAQVPFERLQDPEAIANWPQTLGRDGARTPIPWVAGALNAGFSGVEPWLPVDPAHLPLAVDAQEADPASTLHVARRLIALRRAYPALRTGAIRFVDTNAQLLIFQRGEGADALLLAFNLGFEPVSWSLPDGWTIVDGVNLGAAGEMPPCTGLIARRG